MKKIVSLLLLSSLFLTSVSFANPSYISNSNFSTFVASTDGLADSDELFNMMKNSISQPLVQEKFDHPMELSSTKQQLNVLDNLEQEKYNSLISVDGLTEENRIVLAKVMAYRYREATQVSQKSLEDNFLTTGYRTTENSVVNASDSGTDLRVAGYYVQNKPTAIRLYSDYMSILSNPWIQNSAVAAIVFRDQQFISYVKSGGPWDLKGPLGTYTSYRLLYSLKTGEYIGNHHYGYMGRHAGYSEGYLKLGAGLYQIVSGTSNWSYMSSFFDDPRDQEAMSSGYSQYSVDFGAGIFQ